MSSLDLDSELPANYKKQANPYLDLEAMEFD
jgi:hypothetical protein